MDQENDQTKSWKLSDVAFYGISGGALLLIAILLTLGLLSEEKPPDWTPVDYGLMVALFSAFWGLIVSYLASCCRRLALQKLGDVIGTFATLLLIAFLIAIWLRPHIESGEMISKRAMVFVGVLLLNIIIGLLLFLSDSRKPETPANKADDRWASPLVIVFWPLILFVYSPIGGLFYLIIVGGTAYLGEWIGEKFSHPLLGAIGLPVGLLLVSLGTVLLFARGKKLTIKTFQRKNDPAMH